MKTLGISVLFILFLGSTLTVCAQDCDAIIQQRPVPEANSFVYATQYYTMHTPNGSVTFNALTADGAVAVVFIVHDLREKCIDENSKIHIKFTNGEDMAMVNSAGANCDSKFALYFSEGLGNLGLLQTFREKKIRFVKIWMSNGRWLEIRFVPGMAYNLRMSMNCLAKVMDAPVTMSPLKRVAEGTAPTDSIDATEKIIPPQFDGGDKALKTYFGQHMRRRSIVDRGVVVVSFRVDEHGNVQEPRIMSGVSESVDNEARRLVNTLPKWKPATKNGVPVSAQVKVQIAF